MASYTSPDISGYNSNPPSDDGTESTSNRIDWSTIKNKLDDPIKTYAESIDSATTSAFTTVDGQIADGSAWYKADTGAADAYVVTLSPAVTGNVVGRKTSFKATNTNTGASTLNLNGIGAKAIKRNNGNALVAGDITATRIYTVVWDGTNYILESNYSQNQYSTNANGPYITGVGYDIEAVIPNATWESIGPTGSGADNIWTDLDSLPLGLSWIELHISLDVSHTATSISLFASARTGGSSTGSGGWNRVAFAYAQTGTSDSKRAYHDSWGVKIPVDSANVFELYHSKTASSSINAFIYLTGYGIN